MHDHWSRSPRSNVSTASGKCATYLRARPSLSTSAQTMPQPMRPASLSHRQQNWFALYARTMAAGCPARPRMTVNAATPCTSELRHAWLYSVRSLFPFTSALSSASSRPSNT